MLQTIREKIQGWVAGVIATILCLAFALWGIEYYITNTPDQVTVAEVNGQDIMQSQWDAAYNRIRQAQQMQLADPKLNEAYQTQLKQNVLNGLIQEQVLLRAAEKAGYTMSPAQVGAILQKMPAFQSHGQFSVELFQQALINLSYSLEQFLQSIAQSALLNQVRQSMVESAFVLPEDVNRYLALLNEKRSFGYFLISPDPFLSKVIVEKASIEKYYQEHANEFMNPEQVSLQYLMLSTAEANKNVTVTDQEISQYYAENKAAFNNKPLTDVKSQIQKILIQQKAEQWIANQGETLSNLTYTNPDSLAPAAKALNIPVQTTEFFTQASQSKTGLLAHPKILSAAFSDNVLKQGNNSDLINIDNNTAVVIRVAERKPASAKPLAEVKAAIEKTLKQQAAEKEASVLGEKILQSLKQGASPQALAKQYKLAWVEKNAQERVSHHTDRKIGAIPGLTAMINWIFTQPAPVSKQQPVIEGESVEGYYAVTILRDVIPGTATSVDSATQQNTQKQMTSNFGALDYDLYVKQQMDNAKIKIK